MEPSEIRSIRGSLSRAAFARLLGVTPLTVLRWELPAGSDEARRPRPKMIEVLRKLASEGVGVAGSERGREVREGEVPAGEVPAGEVLVGEELADEDEDFDASEVTEKMVAEMAAPPGESGAEAGEEAQVLALLQQLWGARWRAAEDELLTLLTDGSLKTTSGRVLASLGVAQAQLLGHFDVRGTLTTLMPVLDQVQRGVLSRPIAARAHVLAAALFGAPDTRVHNAGRVNVHAALAESLLAPEDDDLRVFIVAARMSSARLASASIVRIYEAASANVERAATPLSQVLVAQVRAVLAQSAGDAAGAARHGADMLRRAEELSLMPLVVAMLSLQAGQTPHLPVTPADILAHVDLAKAKSVNIVPAEPSMRLLAAEIEALMRLNRLADAEQVYREALGLHRAAGLPLFALAGTVTRLFLLLGRGGELAELAELVGGDASGPVSDSMLAKLHAALLKAGAALAASDFTLAVELAEQLLDQLERRGDTGTEHLLRDTHWVVLRARLALGSEPELLASLRRFETLLEHQPSAWHSAGVSRATGEALSRSGRWHEARRKLEAARDGFELLGDALHGEQTKRALDGVQQAMTQPAASSATPCLAERLADAVERLSIPGQPVARVRAELQRALSELLPAREAVIDLAGAAVRIDVRGETSPEERALLRTLSAVAGLGLDADTRAKPADAPFDDAVVLPGFIAASALMRQLKREIAQLAKSSATILVTGESGSGKEVVARAVHDLSARARAAYVTFNCASVPRDLFESQLFGFKKGSFTGATADSPGVIRAADGGTLFLDEVAELPLDTQPKLLRFLENGEIMPLGERSARRVDVRVVAATHRDLGRLVREGTFREDLYYRLNVVPLAVPPLRERKDDIVALARMFLGRLASDRENPPALSGDAVKALQAHSWPGNVRELRNVIERAMAYHPNSRLVHAGDLRLTRGVG